MDNKIYLFAPQWQDSGSTNELYSGALALKKYFQSVCDFLISDVIIEEVQKPILKHSILGFDVIKKQLSDISSTLERSDTKRIGVIGGGCGIEVPIISYLLGSNPNLQVIWFDAHGDLNSPESSPSKYFHGMPLRFILEEQDNEIGKKYNKLDPANVCLVGTRDLDPPEIDYIESKNINVVKLSENYWSDIESKIRKDVPTYIHLDLDVLDPTQYLNVKCPVEKGLSISELEKTIEHISQATELLGMSIVENVEQKSENIVKLKRIFEKLIAV